MRRDAERRAPSRPTHFNLVHLAIEYAIHCACFPVPNLSYVRGSIRRNLVPIRNVSQKVTIVTWLTAANCKCIMQPYQVTETPKMALARIEPPSSDPKRPYPPPSNVISLLHRLRPPNLDR